MMKGLIEPLGFKTRVDVFVKEKGKVVDHHVFKNAFTDVGFDLIADCLGKAAGRPDVIESMAIGWGVGSDDAFDAGQTDLQGASKSHQPTTYTHIAGTKSIEWSATWTVNVPSPTTQLTVNEIGLFNDSAGGIMLDRILTLGFTKAPSQEIEVIITVTMS